MLETAALLACAILACLAVFQFALIFGVPIGRFAWGGKHDILPLHLRIASVFSILLYVMFAILILSKAGVLNLLNNNELLGTIMWIVTAYFFSGILMNAISRSKPERLIMTPVAAMLTLLFLYVTLAAR